jgi:hypothetical protein
MTPSAKLESLLAAQGIRVLCFRPTLGAWRREDVYRWEARAVYDPPKYDKPDQNKIELCSWDTMTKCARYGIEIGPDDYALCPYGTLEVWARAKRPTPRVPQPSSDSAR